MRYLSHFYSGFVAPRLARHLEQSIHSTLATKTTGRGLSLQDFPSVVSCLRSYKPHEVRIQEEANILSYMLLTPRPSEVFTLGLNVYFLYSQRCLLKNQGSANEWYASASLPLRAALNARLLDAVTKSQIASALRVFGSTQDDKADETQVVQHLSWWVTTIDRNVLFVDLWRDECARLIQPAKIDTNSLMEISEFLIWLCSLFVMWHSLTKEHASDFLPSTARNALMLRYHEITSTYRLIWCTPDDVDCMDEAWHSVLRCLQQRRAIGESRQAARKTILALRGWLETLADA